MSELALLRGLRFGSETAEQEHNVLQTYFIETQQWQRMVAGDIDIVYGPKGSGKSAIFSLMMQRADSFHNRSIELISAEEAHGPAIFANLQDGTRDDMPESEAEFRAMWKLYFASLVANSLTKSGTRNHSMHSLCTLLEAAGLRPRQPSLAQLLSSVLDYLKRIRIKPTVEFSAAGPKVAGEISLSEPTVEDRKRGVTSVNQVLQIASQACLQGGRAVWILLDRLDVAFEGALNVEIAALRALFRTYLDLAAFDGVRLKIFLRSDIWQRLTVGGFREASHITRYTTISWDRSSLLSLIVRRIAQNRALLEHYGVLGREAALPSDDQAWLFSRVLGGTANPQNPSMLAWIIKHTCDASGSPTPREIIHLLNVAQLRQINALELSHNDHCEPLIQQRALRDALPTVSEFRLFNTLYAEYPNLKPSIEALGRAKSGQTLESLTMIWKKPFDDCREIANKLVEIGFFQRLGGSIARFRVPLIYRSALHMSGGSEPEFGEYLSKLRSEAGLSREELADSTKLNVDTIKGIESGMEAVRDHVTLFLLLGALKLDRRPSAESKPIRERESRGQHKPARPELLLEAVESRTATLAPDLVQEERDVAPSEKSNLPRQLTAFIGRVQELEEMVSILRDHKLLTIVGPGGIGKTRLSLELARCTEESYPDGVWFVDLASINRSERVAEAIARAVGPTLSSISDPLESLVQRLTNRRTLLILDSCEHVIDGARAATKALLPVLNVHVIATSRESLNIQGEIVYRVPSLSLPPGIDSLSARDALQYDAVKLFSERARDAEPTFVLANDNARLAASICHRLDGIPLAIELAAARLGTLTLPAMAHRLDERFRVLTSGSRADLPRQKALRASIDWSYDLLTDEEKGVLMHVAALEGAWTFNDAQLNLTNAHVNAPELLDTLTSLVDKSWLIIEDSDDDWRYRMLEAMRAFAVEKLHESGRS